MKEHRALTARQEALAERALFGAVLTLEEHRGVPLVLPRSVYACRTAGACRSLGSRRPAAAGCTLSRDPQADRRQRHDDRTRRALPAERQRRLHAGCRPHERHRAANGSLYCTHRTDRPDHVSASSPRISGNRIEHSGQNLAPESGPAEIRATDRQLARPAGALRAQVQPRQGPADVLRREHAARRAVRARRRYSRPGAGRRLRSRHPRPECHRGKAARVPGARRHAAVRAVDGARLRQVPSVDRRARRHRIQGCALAARQAHCDDVSEHSRPLPAQQRRGGRGRHAVGLDRDRTAPGSRRFHLRPGLDRFDADRESSVGSRDDSRKPGGHHHARRSPYRRSSRNGFIVCRCASTACSR